MSKIKNKAFEQALAEMDATDIQAVEQILTPIPVRSVQARIKSSKGHFFSVDFARKKAKKVNGVVVEPAGAIRHMLCRTGVAKFVQGVQPEGKRRDEDSRHDVLTVWDVGVYQNLRREGMEQELAGVKAYRRINMADVKAISIPPVPVTENLTEQVRVEVGEGVAEPV